MLKVPRDFKGKAMDYKVVPTNQDLLTVSTVLRQRMERLYLFSKLAA